MSLALYIHIPFCKQKCLYCDFPSYQGIEHSIGSYIDCLKKEIEMTSGACKDYKVTTIYIGGGTPSYIDARHIEGILEVCRKNFEIDPDAEISMESNPGTLTKENLLIYKNAGVNRISIGLQAAQNKILKTLGRIHDFKEFEEGYYLARQAGFSNINIDLMLGLPGQTFEDWQETLEKACSLKPEHISAYSLKLEEGTPFYNKYYKEDALELPPEEIERDMYHYAVNFLGEKGFEHYEISNFAKEGLECKHNLVYWKRGPYIGLGLGAHSFFEGKRFFNTYDMKQYIADIKVGKLPGSEKESVSDDEAMS